MNKLFLTLIGAIFYSGASSDHISELSMVSAAHAAKYHPKPVSKIKAGKVQRTQRGGKAGFVRPKVKHPGKMKSIGGKAGRVKAKPGFKVKGGTSVKKGALKKTFIIQQKFSKI